MLSIELIRRDPDFVRASLQSRGEEDPITELLELDAQRRRAVTRRGVFGSHLRSLQPAERYRRGG